MRKQENKLKNSIIKAVCGRNKKVPFVLFKTEAAS